MEIVKSKIYTIKYDKLKSQNKSNNLNNATKIYTPCQLKARVALV